MRGREQPFLDTSLFAVRFDDLKGQIHDCGQVLRRETFPGMAGVLSEDLVQIPVPLVLYTLVPSIEHYEICGVREVLVTDVVLHAGDRPCRGGHGEKEDCDKVRNGIDAAPIHVVVRQIHKGLKTRRH